ncbi:MAG: hypothetical protein ACTHU0_39560 [Kofleriaceae bacterium]
MKSPQRTPEEKASDARQIHEALQSGWDAIRATRDEQLAHLTAVTDRMLTEYNPASEDELYLLAYRNADPALMRGASSWGRQQLREIVARRWAAPTRTRSVAPRGEN